MKTLEHSNNQSKNTLMKVGHTWNIKRISKNLMHEKFN